MLVNGPPVAAASGAAKPLVHITETTRNLAEMRRLASAAGARLIWMTPTACDIGRAASYPPFQAQQIWLHNDAAHALDQAVRNLVKDQDIMVDLQETFGRHPEPGLLQGDGLHPTLAGQQAIAKGIRRAVQPEQMNGTPGSNRDRQAAAGN